MTGDRMRTARRRFDDGISVHAPFTAQLYLGKKATQFTGAVGVDDDPRQPRFTGQPDSLARTDGLKTFFYTDEATQQRYLAGVGYTSADKGNGSIVLQIYGDGKEIWNSGALRKGEKAKDFDLNIAGVQLLQLKVTDAGDGISGDVANLGLLRITTADPGHLQFVPETFAAASPPQNTAALTAMLNKLPVYVHRVAQDDWLLKKTAVKAAVSRTTAKQVVLSNGLVSRTIAITPNAATISLKNLVTGEEFIRAVQPEAIVQLDGQPYDVGGLGGQVDRGYLLTAWLKNMYSLPGSFQLSALEVKDILPSHAWRPKRWLPATQWKASGKELTLSFTHTMKKDVVVKVHHRIFDGIPLLAKSVSVTNNSGGEVILDSFTGEIIAYPERENYVAVPASTGWSKPNLYLENDYAFNGMTYEESEQSIHWETDPAYTSQVNYMLQTPCIVKSSPKVGPAQTIGRGQQWQGFNTYVMPLDGTERERNTLSQRKMYRLLAPWSTENPIFMHLTSTKPEIVKEAVEQCVATGYEMIILSFGSGLNMEDTSAANMNKFRELAAYAHSKGIEIGGYSLFSSRTINPATDVINVKTGKPGGATFGNAPCLGSQWGIDYLKKISRFITYTGFNIFEHDGPYPGDFCASTTHPGHKGYHDSQWNQWKQSIELYQSLLARNVYMNVPDFYFLGGSSKVGIGYREVNWSLPRAQQIVLGRQNLYDGTWQRTPSMSWTFVPLVQYHGGGAAATLEPLSQHLAEYDAHMKQNYGTGVQACYRGNRLYDSSTTKALVQRNIAHYKKYRDILNADVIHLKRPTGSDWDGILHADPALRQKGFAMLYNPLEEPMRIKVKLPLYYTGLKNTARIRVEDGPARVYQLNTAQETEVEVTIPAEGNTWLVIE
jgi:hypothetical protein